MQNWFSQPLPLLVFHTCRVVILWGGLGVVGTLIVVATIAIAMTPVPSLRGVTPPTHYPHTPEVYCYTSTRRGVSEEHCLQETLEQVRGMARFLPVPDVKGP